MDISSTTLFLTINLSFDKSTNFAQLKQKQNIFFKFFGWKIFLPRKCCAQIILRKLAKKILIFIQSRKVFSEEAYKK